MDKTCQHADANFIRLIHGCLSVSSTTRNAAKKTQNAQRKMNTKDRSMITQTDVEDILSELLQKEREMEKNEFVKLRDGNRRYRFRKLSHADYLFNLRIGRYHFMIGARDSYFIGKAYGLFFVKNWTGVARYHGFIRLYDFLWWEDIDACPAESMREFGL